MPAGAVALLVLVSVESFKVTSRLIHKRKSKKHGYSDLKTDSLGRPINEHGRRLSKNEAKALAAHQKEIERIRTAEREWRAEGERLPKYEETSNEAILQSLHRPRTAPASGIRSAASHSQGPCGTGSSSSSTLPVDNPPQRERAMSAAAAAATGSTSSSNSTSTSRHAGAFEGGLPAVQALEGGAFVVRRHPHMPPLQLLPSNGSQRSEIHDILQNDGMDWRRATWEAPPIYRETVAAVVVGH